MDNQGQTRPKNTITQQTLNQFKERFVKECSNQGTTELELTYEELSNIVGLSKGATFKAMEALDEKGFIEKIPAASRRFPNKYILRGPIELSEVGVPNFKDGEEFIGSFIQLQKELRKKNEEMKELKESFGEDILSGVHSMMEELADYKTKYEKLKMIIGDDVQIESTNTLPGGYTQIIYKDDRKNSST